MKSFWVLLSVCLLLAAVQAKSIFEQLEDEVMEFKSVDVDKKDKDDINKDLKRDFRDILDMFTHDEKLGWKMLEKLLNEFVKEVFHDVFSPKKEGRKKKDFGSGSGEGSSSGSGGSSGSGSEGTSSGSGGSSGSGSEGSSSGSGGSSGSGSEGSSSGSGQSGSAVSNNGPAIIVSQLQQETL